MFRPLTAALALCLVCVSPAAAQIIDFETVPGGGAPTDDAPLGLASAYTVGALSITFGFDGNLDGIPETPAVFELSGPDVVDGFAACGGRDVAAPGFAPQLGGFFLRGNSGADFGVLIIDYSGGVVNGASGEIWDIDGEPQANERYRVRAFNSSGGLLATIDSPASTQPSGCTNTELDGKPWVFNFSSTPGIARITIDFTGTKTSGIGLAFNNFNATGEQPVPARAATWGVLKSIYR